MAATRKARKPRSSTGKKGVSRSENSAQTETARQSGTKEKAHPLEWVVGSVAALCILAALGYLGFRGLSGDGQPADFTATVEAVQPVGDLFHVTVAVTNSGDETAAGVLLEAEIGEGGGAEQGEIQFDYLPAGSTRRGTFVFSSDPSAAGELRLSVRGYTDP